MEKEIKPLKRIDWNATLRSMKPGQSAKFKQVMEINTISSHAQNISKTTNLRFSVKFSDKSKKSVTVICLQ